MPNTAARFNKVSDIYACYLTGLGYRVAVIAFGSSLAANLIFNATYGDGYYDYHKWPVGLSLVFSAATCWFVGKYLRKRDQITFDEKTGKEIISTRSRHTLFFIPMHYWAPIFLVLALICFFLEFTR